MKRILLLITSLILTFQIFGKEITIEQAKQVAESYLYNNMSSSLKSVTNIELNDIGDIFNRNSFSNSRLKSTSVKNRNIYIFNIGDNNGFIIVSGDDAAIPILAYSSSASINPNKTPQNVIKWLEGYKQQIHYIKTNNIEQTETIKILWSGSANNLKSTQSGISPLLSTQWDQSPYFNAKCPYDNDYQELTVTGCPATAMAQIMKYWEYPAKGFGFHSYQHDKYGILSANFGATYYDWDAMTNTVNSTNDAIATLMYHCGVAVEMNYGVDCSSSYVIKDKSPSDNQTVEYALPTYFGYASTLEGIERANYSDNDWEAILKAELNAGRPIQYAGFGQGGHTFVCDGYDENDYFHMNWGWGGYYDGYFLLDALTPGTGGIGSGTGSYNEGQQALIGIKPPDAPQTYELEIYSDVVVDKSTIAYGEGFTISTDILNDGSNAFSGDYCAAAFNEDNVFIDFVEIKTGFSLNSGYHYTNGIDFTTDGMLTLLPGNYNIYIFYRPTDGNWNVINADYWDLFTDDYTELKVVNENLISLYSTIDLQTPTIYTNNSLSVWLDIANYSTTDFTGIFDVSLYNLEGEFVTTIEEKTNMSLTSNSHYTYGLTFSTENVNVEPGTYLLALLHKWDGCDYEITGSTSSYINPIKVVVKQVPLEKDIYENNNTINDSYSFTAIYDNNSSKIETSGSNIHVGNDWDFYSIDLESGYNYNIDIRLHDSYNSGNENSYSVDGLFLYSMDGINWSEIYDDEMASSITTSGDKTLYCVVSPYFLGETGTYLLNFDISRTVNTSVVETSNISQISVYPNPCNDFVYVTSNEKIIKYAIYDLNGILLLSGKLDNNNPIDISVLTNGTYFIDLTTTDDHYTSKIIKQ